MELLETRPCKLFSRQEVCLVEVVWADLVPYLREMSELEEPLFLILGNLPRAVVLALTLALDNQLKAAGFLATYLVVPDLVSRVPRALII